MRPGGALAAATIMTLPIGSIYAFSVLLVPLEQLFQASRSELASVFGISAVFFTIGANLAPRLFGWIRAPLLVALTGALSCRWSSSGGLRTLSDLAHPRLRRAVRNRRRDGLRRGATMREYGAARPAWTGQRLSRQSFSSRCHAGRTSLGLGLDWVGVRVTLVGLAAVIGATALAATVLVAYDGVVLAKTTSRPTASAAGSEKLQATFWKLFTIFFLAASAGLMVLSQAAGMVTAFGAGKSASVLATTGITAAIAAARVLGGWLIDRLPVPLSPRPRRLSHCSVLSR